MTFFCAWQDVSDAVLSFLRASDLSALEASARALSRFRNRSREAAGSDGPVALARESLAGEASVALPLRGDAVWRQLWVAQRCVCGWMAIRPG